MAITSKKFGLVEFVENETDLRIKYNNIDVFIIKKSNGNITFGPNSESFTDSNDIYVNISRVRNLFVSNDAGISPDFVFFAEGYTGISGSVYMTPKDGRGWFGFPSLTETERDNLPGGELSGGICIWNSTAGKLQCYNGIGWSDLF